MSHTEATVNHAARAGAHTAGPATDEVVITEDGRVLNDPTHKQKPDHGNTPAGWAMAILAIVGFALGCIGLLASWEILIWIGVALLVLGAAAGLLGSRFSGRGVSEDASDVDDARTRRAGH
ncbi:HGxxPAAW family protein [Micrococcus sp.]|uniref:HGxxPAAW family protein n=1 Tax=Micrococcus sp. TaxID=1271 RepID=UPI0026DC696B|nr:HGxxPAAW family protein [Micrococcus sp.]MDO4239469.1 HGxxPAAW family protein [Micrococcus sp.]